MMLYIIIFNVYASCSMITRTELWVVLAELQDTTDGEWGVIRRLEKPG